MIELFKIIKGMCDLTRAPHFDFIELSEDSIRTSGNKIQTYSTSLSLRLKEICLYLPTMLYPYGYATVYPIM